MQKIEGIYSAINALIKERENDGDISIELDEIVDAVKDEVDVYSASTEWLIDYVVRHAVTTGLNMNGYYSLVRGEGLFVSLDKCTNLDAIGKLVINSVEDVNKFIKILEKKQQRYEEVEGQMEMDFSRGGYKEALTDRKLLEMFRTYAEMA